METNKPSEFFKRIEAEGIELSPQDHDPRASVRRASASPGLGRVAAEGLPWEAMLAGVVYVASILNAVRLLV